MSHDKSNKTENCPGHDLSLFFLLSTQHIGDEINLFPQLSSCGEEELRRAKILQPFQSGFHTTDFV